MMQDIFCRRIGLLCLVILVAGPWAVVHAADDERKDSPPLPETLVREALEAELSGDNNLREAKLYLALQADPQFAAARWHSGHVHVNDQWLTVEDAQQVAQQDEVLAKYREKRAGNFGTAAGELKLARWCRGVGLHDVAKAHWWQVLRADPQNREAASSLGLRRHANRLMSEDQIDAIERHQDQVRSNLKTWEPNVDRWRKDILRDDQKKRDAALGQFRRLDDPAAIPALINLLVRKSRSDDNTHQLHVAIINALGRMDDPSAVRALAWQAATSEFAEVRNLAATHLKRHPLHAYVPAMLAEMRAPYEMSVETNADYGNVTNTYTVYSERPDGYERKSTYRSRHAIEQIVYIPYTVNKKVFVPGGTVPSGINCYGDFVPGYTIPDRYASFVVGSGFAATGKPYQERKKNADRYAHRTYEKNKAKVEQRNKILRKRNRKIRDSLATATGEELNESARACWDWWKKRNPLANAHRYLAGDTIVWAEMGPMKIQDIRRGDRVLAQHPLTGEVAFKVVLREILQKESPSLHVALDESALVVSPSQAPWVARDSWQTAASISQHDRLHGLTKSYPVRSVREGLPIDAYGLIVSDFHTFLAGDAGILFHDATPAMKLPNPLPGLETAPAQAQDVASAIAP